MSAFQQDVAFWLAMAAAVFSDGIVELLAWVVGI
jgi:hypothetical protein